MNHLVRAVIVVAVLGGAVPAYAAEGAAPAPAGPARAGWYVAPMATYMKPDSGRCNVDDGLGASVALGNRGDFASLEVWGQFLSLSHGGCTYTVPDGADMDSNRDPVNEPAGTVKLNGGGIALLVGPFFDTPALARLFGIVGFGVLLREDHPQYTQDDSTIFGDVGLGYAHPFQLFGLDVIARTEVRYRYDVQQPPHPDNEEPAPPHNYQDLIFNLGLQFALSAPEPVEEPAPEPVAVVAVADADGDGVPDETDTCPGTGVGTMVDATGCEPPPAVAAAPAEPTLQTAKAGDTIVLHGVNFETARATLTTNARTLLDAVAADLAARPGLKVEIGGHTDSRGNEAYNQSLSEKRAQSVQAYLVGQGVAAERLTAVGYGEAQPTDSNDTDEGRERNRRVELKVLEQAEPPNPSSSGDPS